MSLDAFARETILRAWPPELGRPTLAARQAAQAISRHETVYATTWTGPLASSHNWGAVQCAAPKTARCGNDCAGGGDRRPDGSTYRACFRVYPSDIDGARDFLRVLLVRRPSVARVIGSGRADVIARAMHATRYYEGIGHTVEERVAGYARAISRNVAELARSLGEPNTLEVHPRSKSDAAGIAVALLAAWIMSN